MTQSDKVANWPPKVFVPPFVLENSTSVLILCFLCDHSSLSDKSCQIVFCARAPAEQVPCRTPIYRYRFHSVLVWSALCVVSRHISHLSTLADLAISSRLQISCSFRFQHQQHVSNS